MKMRRISFAPFLLLVILAACSQKPIQQTQQGLSLEPARFADITNWGQDSVQEALPALEKSCSVFMKRAPDRVFSLPKAGRIQDWQEICRQIPPANALTEKKARAFFEQNFTPYKVREKDPGLFTGYYEAQLNGSLRNEGPYQFPLWGKPDDYVKGRPYDSRGVIDTGSLWGRAKPIMWLEDPIDGFFMEIQGSGRIKLPDGSVRHLGYAAQNGHAYVPIGRVLLAEQEIERPVTMQKIRDWLDANPAREREILNANPSYVFFHEIEEGPIGAMGLPVTPMRSLAVDPSFVPLGIPLWLETESHQRLVIAQDTGGAIKGAVRGDLFWGAGPEAEFGAGKMQEAGRYWLLLPRKAVR